MMSMPATERLLLSCSTTCFSGCCCSMLILCRLTRSRVLKAPRRAGWVPEAGWVFVSKVRAVALQLVPCRVTERAKMEAG